MRITRLGPAIAAVALVLALVFRFYDLEHNPPGLWQDEASTGVDAYMIWTTGKDRAGVSWPIISRSFGDYPFALYRYLDAPVVGLLGLTPGHERVVAATLSMILVIALVFTMRRVFGPATALGAMLSAAICPTWIHLARYGSEQILLPTTLMLALMMFEVGKDEGRRGWLWGGAIALGLSAYSYHAAKVLLPLWTIGFLIYFWPTIQALWTQEKKHVIGPVLIVLFFVIPSIMIAMTPEGNARARDAAAFFKLNSKLDLALNIGRLYGFAWRPDRLFFTGPNHVVLSPPGLGMWAWSDLALMLLGLGAVFVSLRAHPGRRLALFFFYWFLIGPIPYALGYEQESITRLIGWLPAPQAIAGLGFGWLVAAPRLARARPYLLGGIVTLWAASSVRVFDRLLINYPKVAQREWQFEISEALLCARRHAEKAADRPLLVVSPQFTYADTFAAFHYLGLPKLKDGRAAYTLSNRKTLANDELFIAPSSVPQPEGSERICTVYWPGTNPPSEQSYVYRSLAAGK